MPALFEAPVLARGFRPFFLLGALYASFSIFVWSGFYAGWTAPLSVFSDPVFWHAHEMVYGFVMAIVAGFLLTAVANWTGGAPARQIHLAALCLLWLAGRLAVNTDILPLATAAVVDCAFLPALAVSLAIPLLRSRSRRNFVFLGLLSLLFACNAAFYLTENMTALYVALLVVLSMISLIGGRVIPAFTVAALRRSGREGFQTDQPKKDILALASLFTLILCTVLIGPDHALTGGVALLSSFIHALRMRVYHTRLVWRDPMLWILHLGYGWLVAALFLMSLAGVSLVPLTIALHAATAGAIGSMTIGMMCRVALGHTGRNLIASKMTVFMFVLIQGAAFLRIFGPLFMPDAHPVWVTVSGILWGAGFGSYALFYGPVLWSPRPDGRPA